MKKLSCSLLSFLTHKHTCNTIHLHISPTSWNIFIIYVDRQIQITHIYRLPFKLYNTASHEVIYIVSDINKLELISCIQETSELYVILYYFI